MPPAVLKGDPGPREGMVKTPTIEQTFYYAVAPERVYAAFTEPSELTRWFADQAKVAAKKGGAYRLTWSTGYTMRGKVKRAEPGKELVVTWVDRFEGGRVFETEARFTFAKRGRGTQLKVTHRGFKSGKRWIALYGAIQSGWAYYLTNLRSVVEHGIDLRSDRDALG